MTKKATSKIMALIFFSAFTLAASFTHSNYKEAKQDVLKELALGSEVLMNDFQKKINQVENQSLIFKELDNESLIQKIIKESGVDRVCFYHSNNLIKSIGELEISKNICPKLIKKTQKHLILPIRYNGINYLSIRVDEKKHSNLFLMKSSGITSLGFKNAKFNISTKGSQHTLLFTRSQEPKKAFFDPDSMIYKSSARKIKGEDYQVYYQPKPLTFINKTIYKTSAYFIILAIVTIVVFISIQAINDNQKSVYKKLEYQASHDNLTGLFNTTYLDSWFYHKNPDTPFALMFIDLDNFKYINDTYGHSIGNSVIKRIAERLLRISSKEDKVIRFGGDEFIIIKYNETPLNDTLTTLFQLISKPITVDGVSIRTTASIGVSEYPKNSLELSELISFADLSMFSAKEVKNTWKIYDAEVSNKIKETSSLGQELKDALTKKEILMNYQPQFDTQGNVYGFEALVRWNNKKRGWVPPDTFIPLAEDSGIIHQLGNFVIDRSLKDFKAIEKLHPNLKISINISPKQLIGDGFYQELIYIVNKYELAPKRIVLEVTESVFINDMGKVNEIFHKLKSKGFSIALDDFGTGYSSLSIIKDIDFDIIKIDKSFIAEIKDNNICKMLVKSIIEIGKNMDIRIISEGVETEAQIVELKMLGCDVYQGYLISKPLTYKKLQIFIESNRPETYISELPA